MKYGAEESLKAARREGELRNRRGRVRKQDWKKRVWNPWRRKKKRLEEVGRSEREEERGKNTAKFGKRGREENGGGA